MHSFDLVAPLTEVQALTSVTVHTGDSHLLLPQVLSELAHAGHNADLVLVDGDHTADGVERDLRDLLASDAINSSVIVIHDTMNDEVRAGVARIDAAEERKVMHVDLEFLAGRLQYGDALHHQLWGGLGVIMVGAAGTSREHPIRCDNAYPTYGLVAPVRDVLVACEHNGQPTGPSQVRDALAASCSSSHQLLDLRAQLTDLQRDFGALRNSKSWRLTALLRATARLMRKGRG